jgi:class 3 adenylate cyclase/CHASE2 domain-containing sensor protein
VKRQLQQKSAKYSRNALRYGARIAGFSRRVWKQLGAHATFLGVVLTLLIATLDWYGHLQPIERIFYNSRARHCQFFTPPPPDKLVHVDIDDTALETIGRWPWPRTTLAEIIDELRICGASELSTDILQSDPEDPGIIRKPDGSLDVIDHDANLAAAIRRFGNVVVPVDFAFDPPAPRTPLLNAMVRALEGDLQLLQEEMPAHIPAHYPLPTEDEFLQARREAMTARLEDALARDSTQSMEALRARLLPRVDRALAGSSIMHEFEVAFPKAQCSQEMTRFALPAASSAGPVRQMLIASEELTMTLPFAKAAGYSGFMNYFPIGSNPTIEVIPICVLYHGHVYPQMDLSLACAALKIDPREIIVEQSRIILPRTGDKQIIIPVHSVRADIQGTVSMFMDIPWFGGQDWKAMYDYPTYKRPTRHVPIILPWAIAEARKPIVKNNIIADNAIGYFSSKMSMDSATNFLKKPPGADQLDARLTATQAILDEATQLAGDTINTPVAKLSPDEKDFVDALSDLRNSIAANRMIAVQLKQKIAELRTLVGGKSVLIGSTATALGDKDPIPLGSVVPGVVIHGVVFDAIYGNYFWHSAPPWVTLAITLCAGLLITWIVIRLEALRALLLTFLIAVSYLLINFLLLFDYGKWIVGTAGPMMVIALVWGALTLIRFIAETQERARITRRFQSYIDPAIVQYVLDHPELERLEGQFREMTVCFTDIAGFTKFTEKLREKAVQVLGRYIVAMVPPIRNNGGLIHHRMGDGIMFSYGAPIPNPDMGIGAVTTTLQMNEELAKLNDELEAEGIPRLKMRAGVNTGMAVVGDSGADDATEYACLGDTTNLASRLEGANTFTGTKILISGRTAELCRGQFLLRPVARLIVKGKSEPVMTYEPIARMDAATDVEKELAAMSAAVFDHFISSRFAGCMAAADALEEKFGPAVFAKLYRDLSARYQANPPENFEGNIVLDAK